MVVTRSHQAVGSPRPPNLPKKKRSRKTSSGDSSDEQDSNLETISEEDESCISNSNLDSNEKKSSNSQASVVIKQRKSSSYVTNTIPSQRLGKTPLKIPDTITEESPSNSQTDGDSHETIQKHSDDTGEIIPSTSKKKNPFYFPPPKSLAPVAISASIDAEMDVAETYIDVKGTKLGKEKIQKLYAKMTVNTNNSNVKDCVITPDFERNEANATEKTTKQKRKERKAIRDASTGKEWFDMKQPELTDDVKTDLKILQMRGVLDPKRFYKHNDRKAIPRYFQVGKIMDSPADFFSARVPKKQRKPNLTEELLADAEFQRYQKRKYNDIQMQKKAAGHAQRRIKRQKLSKRAKKAI